MRGRYEPAFGSLPASWAPPSANFAQTEFYEVLVLDFTQADRGGVSFEMFSPLAYERRVQVDRQRIARLIARFALGIAVGAGLAFLLLRYL